MATPSSRIGTEMSERESRSFLASNDNGVLSLAAENRGYGFPISYAFEEGTDHIVLGFVISPGSRKEEFVTETAEATFTVYSHADVDSWQSVIARGPIQSVETDDGTNRVPDLFYRQESDDADDDELVNLDEFDRTWYELRIDSISGRRSGSDR